MSEIQRHLCFNLGKEEFAIPLLSVKEVIGVPETTPIPQSPAHFVGIMNLRGSVISVMDLRVKLGIKPQPSSETAVIILELGGINLGMIVDQVNAVVPISDAEISEKPHMDSSKMNEVIVGVYRKEDHLILLLNIAKALSVEDKSVINKTLKAA